MRSRQPQPSQFVSRAGVVGLAPEGAWGQLSHWRAVAKEGAVQLSSFATSRRSSAAKALTGSSVQGISIAKGQRLPALSCRVVGAAAPRRRLLAFPHSSKSLVSSWLSAYPVTLGSARAGASGAISPAYLAALPANITVKVVPAFGLHWTSRKRAALYLKR